MTKIQVLKKQMYARVRAFFATHQTVFSSYTPLLKEIAIFEEQLIALEAAEGAQAKIVSDVAARKERLLRTWATALKMLNITARAYARRVQPDLLPVIHTKAAYYILTSGEEAAERGKASIAVLRAHAADIIDKGYNLTTEQVDQVYDRIVAFEAILSRPSTEIDQKKQGTADMAQAMRQIDDALRVVDDLIPSKYAIDQWELVAAYRLARRIGQPQTNSTTLRAHVVEEGRPVWRAEVLIRELGRRAETDMEGYAEIKQFRRGDYHIDVYRDGALVASRVARFMLGKTVHLTIDVVGN